MRHSPTIAFHTLGCKLNFSETSGIANTFQEDGFARVELHEGADIVVVNTCSVTEQADKKCRQIVRQARRANPHAFIAVIGCYAQLKPNEIAEMKGVNLVLGANEKFNLLTHYRRWEKDQFTNESVAGHIKEVKEFHPSYSMGDRTRTFLKVQDGCDYFCSFCTIPLARGRSRSHSVAATLIQAEEIAKTDCREVVLTGVNIGDFGKGTHENFLDLIGELEKVEGIDRFRISSIEPNLLSNEIIEFVASSGKFVPHFHIPLQSGSNDILQGMRRKYDTSLYTSRVEKIRELMPHACIGVDVISGYPGESEKHFLKTYHYLNELAVDYLHVFTYSKRPNTVAYRFENQVPMQERREHSKRLQLLSEKKKRFFYSQHIGKTYPVLFESREDNGEMFGFTDNYIKVKMMYRPEWVNQIKNVKLEQLLPDGVVSATEVETVEMAVV